MEQVRRQGRQSLILVPEIALTPQLLDRLEARFPGDVAVLHSGLTAAERWRHWWRIAHGAVKVVAGGALRRLRTGPGVGVDRRR